MILDEILGLSSYSLPQFIINSWTIQVFDKTAVRIFLIFNVK